ncbi:TM2 domain-containing protein [Niabella terrae]
MDHQQLLRMFPDMDYEEIASIINLTKDMNDQQRENFLMIYRGKRKDQQTLLILCLLGFVGVAGIHRLITGDIALGILYFFTAGLCFVGTIVDLINIKKLTLNHNQAMAYESARLATTVFR